MRYFYIVLFCFALLNVFNLAVWHFVPFNLTFPPYVATPILMMGYLAFTWWNVSDTQHAA